MVNDKRAGTVVSRSRDTELLELTRSDYFRVLQQKDTLLVSCTSHVDPIADITIPQSITRSTSAAGLHMEGVSAVCVAEEMPDSSWVAEVPLLSTSLCVTPRYKSAPSGSKVGETLANMAPLTHASALRLPGSQRPETVV